jgi:hypothetical protein
VAVLNAAGTGVDDVYINVLPPQPVLLSGTGLFNGATVGAASWGPVNTPITVNTPQQALATFGPPINSGFDIVQDAALFLNQGPAGGVTCVRVAGTGATTATGTIEDSASAAGANGTALYPGSFGSQIVVTIAAGSNSATGALTWKVSTQLGTQAAQVWDRIPGQTGAVAWANIISAVNTGYRGAPPSNCVRLALPSTPSALLPVAQSVTFTGGSNGAALTTTQQIGVDGGSGSRTGMYALRGTGFDTVWLAGNSDSTSWATLLAFAKSEGGECIGSFPLGTSVASAVTAKLSAGIDDPQMILLLGWVTYLDTQLNTNVTFAPSGTAAGLICSVQPHQSPGNRQVYGLLGTEQTLGTNPQGFSYSDLTTLEANGINTITSPIPSANALGLRHGKNTSSNFATSEIPYARKTNSIVRDLSGTVMGQFVNRLQTTQTNDPLRNGVLAALNGYFGPQVSENTIDAYNVICDLTNNTPQTIAAGQLFATVIVQYLAVVDTFTINLTAGQTVSVTAQSTAATATGIQ